MPTKYFVEIGRVALIHFGPDAGSICTIVDIIDQNRALIDGPKVNRQAISFKKLRLTKFRIRIPHGTSTKTVVKAWEKSKIDEKWKGTLLARRLEAAQLKANMTDFDRFKLYKTKQQLNKLVNRKFLNLKGKLNKEKKSSKLEKKDKKPKETKQVKKTEKKVVKSKK